MSGTINRREFLSAATLALASLSLPFESLGVDLPVGGAPNALEFPWFPNRNYTFIWRNWGLLPVSKIAATIGAREVDVVRAAKSMGLEKTRTLSLADRRRANLTIIRRNWHLLPYEQLLKLLEWTDDELAYTLREDDFFFVKLGSLKPKCPPLKWSAPSPEDEARAADIRATLQQVFPRGGLQGNDPLFSFVKALSKAPSHLERSEPTNALRLGYSYFALYGDPLLDPSLDPYPDGYLARLAAAGVNAVWLQGVLARLSPLPWSPESHIDQRRRALRELAQRAAKHGIKIFLYLNEPRALPTNTKIFAQNPTWRGVAEGDFTAVCTGAPEVRKALTDAVASLCDAVPELGGFFTITASENLSNCWSHYQGAACPRCRLHSPAQSIAEVNGAIFDGIRAASGQQRLLAWDWGWQDAWAADAIHQLPDGVDLMSVSEWSLPIERGGINSAVGEYSLSSIGPGPRAMRHWALAKKRGLSVVAKIQTGNTWEISAVPYIPVLENIARHVSGIRAAGVDNLMLGWTLGGRPSPNMEAVAEISSGGSLENLAERRHGKKHAAAVVKFWRDCSAAFREFPFDGGVVYNAPLQVGPANPLWLQSTQYRASMVGIPYDDLDAWRGPYPPEIFAGQLEKVAAGFEAALREATVPTLTEQLRYAEAAAIHFASVANQTRFVLARRAGNKSEMRRLAEADAALARRLHGLQSSDSQIGFEASNQYFYTPLDLAEKIINARWIVNRLS